MLVPSRILEVGGACCGGSTALEGRAGSVESINCCRPASCCAYGAGLTGFSKVLNNVVPGTVLRFKGAWQGESFVCWNLSKAVD